MHTNYNQLQQEIFPGIQIGLVVYCRGPPNCLEEGESVLLRILHVGQTTPLLCVLGGALQDSLVASNTGLCIHTIYLW